MEPNLNDPRIARLPAGFRVIAEHLGYGICARLADLVPGARLHIPRQFDASVRSGARRTSPFYHLSDEDCRALCREFGGDVLIIPSQLSTPTARRDAIKAALQKNTQINEIALDVGMSRVRVSKIIGGVRDELRHEIQNLQANGASDKEISQRAGVHPSWIRKFLKVFEGEASRRCLTAPQSNSDARLTPHEQGASPRPSRNIEKPVRERESAF